MINREYKDRVFKIIFGRKEHKDWILSLYNAVNGTSYTDADAIEINTMEDVLYMGMRNDVSFLFQWDMSVYEHQSTYNPNMPLRLLMYLARLYEKHMKRTGQTLYGDRIVRLPVPRLVTFYNGTAQAEDEKELHLYDAFPKEADVTKSDVTVRVRMINVNAGHNKAMLEACRPLGEYAWLVERVRTNGKTMDIEAAVDQALGEMPEDYLIKPLLMANRAEVKMSILTEYNEEEVKETLKEIYLQTGREEGGDFKLITQTMRKLARNKSPEQIVDELEEEESLIREIISAIEACGPEADAVQVYEIMQKDPNE